MVPLPATFNPIRIAMARNDHSVALSSGRHIRLYACHTGAVVAEGELELDMLSMAKSKQNPKSKEVPYQALGFCEQGNHLIVATQDYSDDVETCIWKCNNESIMDGQVGASREFLGSIRIITVRTLAHLKVCLTLEMSFANTRKGYGDYRGVNTVLHSSLNRITFIAGFSGKRYPNIVFSPDSPLSQGNQSSSATKVAYVKCKTNQIHCAAMSPSSSLIAFIDSRDSVSLVDLRSPGFPVHQLGDISHERLDASPAEKSVTITMLDECHVYVYFVVNLQPRLIRFSVGGSKDIINTNHLLRDAAALDSS
jgi:hypothetical protein